MVRRESPLLPRREGGLFEPREHVLAKNRGEDIFDFTGEKADLRPGAGVALRQIIKHQHLAKDRGGLGGGERGIVIEITLLAAETAVQAVSQFMGQSHDVPKVVGIVAKDVGMELRRRRGAEGAATLALANFSVNPILGKEF